MTPIKSDFGRVPGPLVLIYSGGMDSTTLLHEFKRDISICLSFDYGSKHNARELSYAARNCTELGVEHITINLDFVNHHFSSDLLKSGGDIPKGHYHDRSMKKTVVPFRNGIMLSIAAGLAESRGAHAVAIANHAGDHHIYPDCREKFIDSMRAAVAAGTDDSVSLFAPYTAIDKRAVALRGRELGVDFTKTWSCYVGGELHCGECGTCVERMEALQGFDATIYCSGRDGARL